MHTETHHNIASWFLYLCLGTASISFWEKPALGTINQDNYLSEISLNTYNSNHISASNLSVNPKLKLSIRKPTETEKQLKPVGLSSELLTGHINENKINQKIAQTDSSEVIGDTLGEANKLRQELLIDPITVNVATFNGAPGSTAGTPSAYGANWGQAYVGGGLYFPLDKGRTDGSLSVGFGLGDAVKSVGVEVNANITSVGGGNSNFDFGDSGSLGFKVHKYLGDGTAIAVGYSNPVTWGDSNKSKDTIYGVATKSFNLQPSNPDNKMPLTISLGVGSGSFRSKGAIVSGENPANIFGSIGIRTAPQVAWVSSWTGNRLNIGGSFAPFKQSPIVINAIFTDVTNNFDDGLGISLSAGYAIRF